MTARCDTSLTIEGDQVVVAFRVTDCSQRLYQLLERVVGRVADQFALCYDERDNTLLGELYFAECEPWRTESQSFGK